MVCIRRMHAPPRMRRVAHDPPRKPSMCRSIENLLDTPLTDGITAVPANFIAGACAEQQRTDP